jgi:hypothetical protein
MLAAGVGQFRLVEQQAARAVLVEVEQGAQTLRVSLAQPILAVAEALAVI